MFRRFLACGGVYGSRDSLGWLRQAVAGRRPDALLFAGGIVARQRRNAVKETPWSLSLEDSRFIQEFLTTLGRLGVFSAVLPGLAGEPLDEFLRLGMQAELTFPTVHVAHATLVEAGGLAVTGIGLVVGERRILGMDSYSRTTAEYFLRPLWQARQTLKVLLMAAPPAGRLGGPKGSTLVAELIDSFHPGLCVVAGESDCRGRDKVGHTQVINPGCLADGWAVWLDLGRAGAGQVEFVNLRDVAAQPAAAGAPEAAAPPCHGPHSFPSQGSRVSEDEVRLRAYLHWEAAGKPSGTGTRFWLEAEDEVRHETAMKP